MAAHLAHLEQTKALPVITAVMEQAGLNIPMDRWDIRTSGSAHTIVNMGGSLSVRVAKTQQTAHLVARRTEILRRLPQDLPFAVPRPITRVITRGGLTGVGLTWIKGEPRGQGAAPAKQLAKLFKGIHSIDYRGYGPYLDIAHEHWCSRDQTWDAHLRANILPQLLRSAQRVAEAAIEQVLALPTVDPVLVHGDLAGHNILWNGDKLVGVIDWDHATLADPAIDYAAVGNFYGWESLAKAVNTEQLERARAFSYLLPLQSLAYTVKHGMSGAIQRLALERADEWYLDHREEIVG
ncbi:MAG: phosphotransferase [Rothia sp. (in: high G+C Gram-positive bacteria)]|nr:phosphotransferase [Rothia sp. (in: high G+C Gram-positive bacteria)]